ncbi:unnamed protein product [Amoebophrya sp. A120]|nr:unnamed protein product [Amoebophrya sp. A120]|eukprot:GSA120T00016083001.1
MPASPRATSARPASSSSSQPALPGEGNAKGKPASRAEGVPKNLAVSSREQQHESSLWWYRGLKLLAVVSVFVAIAVQYFSPSQLHLPPDHQTPEEQKDVTPLAGDADAMGSRTANATISGGVARGDKDSSRSESKTHTSSSGLEAGAEDTSNQSATSEHLNKNAETSLEAGGHENMIEKNENELFRTYESQAPPESSTTTGGNKKTTAVPTSFRFADIQEVEFSEYKDGWKSETLLELLGSHVKARVPLILRNVGVPRGVESLDAIVEGVEQEDQRMRAEEKRRGETPGDMKGVVSSNREKGKDKLTASYEDLPAEDYPPGQMDEEDEDVSENLLTLYAAPHDYFEKKFGKFGSERRYENLCNGKGLPYGRFEAPIRNDQVWLALNGSSPLERWGPAVHQDYCEHLHLQDEEGLLDRPADFRCTMGQMRKLLKVKKKTTAGASTPTNAQEQGPRAEVVAQQRRDRGSYQLYLREDLLGDLADYPGANSPVLPYLHDAILKSPSTPPMEIPLDPAGHDTSLRYESRVLRGGSPNSHAFANVDCYSNLLLSYFGRKDMYLFDALPIVSTPEPAPTRKWEADGKNSYSSSFETLWKLLRIGEDLMLDAGAPGAEMEANTAAPSSTLVSGQDEDHVDAVLSGKKKQQQQNHKSARQTVIVDRLRKRFAALNLTISKISLAPGDAVFIPELWYHDAAMVDAVFGMNVFYSSNVNGGETLCKFLKGYGPESCGGRVSAAQAVVAANKTMTSGVNWKIPVSYASLFDDGGQQA